MFEITADTERVSAWLDRMPAKVRASLERKINELAQKLRTHIVSDKLLGQVLNRRTGGLGRSIQEKVTVTQDSVTGIVYSSGDVKYAAIHEYGGTINHPGGTPYMINSATGLAIFIHKNEAISQYLPKTAAHVINMPQRSYMRSSLADQKDDIVNGLTDAINEGTQP